ncbi:MAG: anaerobic sulfatase maturase [Lachnospiraceae bacterium]|nr:anaerobic sulfatase maturase [Lachnospiraceae bacterium]
MNELSLLLKPASGLCNMRCSYCFYREETASQTCFEQNIMSSDVMELLCRRACESAEKYLHIAFQGGEPTLAGVDFYRRFTALIEAFAPRGLHIEYAFQTNGLLLDEEWMEFFRKHHCLVGLSFDGMRQLHDQYRLDAAGKGTADRVQRAWKQLQDAKVDTNLLCVVTRRTAAKPERVYRYLKEMGAAYLQFIPCMDFSAPVTGTSDPGAHSGTRENTWSLKGDEYAHFLKGLFDLWYRDWKNGSYVSIRQFDDYIHLLCGERPSACSACGECGGYLVVENDGSVYPCDFYVEDDWLLGSIKEASLEELSCGEDMRKFQERSCGREEACRKCRYYVPCRGGCRHDWTSGQGMAGGKNLFCEAYQEFFAYALPRMQEIAEAERRYRQAVRKR